MHELFDERAPKKPANLSINSDLLSKSRGLNINLSATLERALKAELQKAEAEKWRVENKTAIEAYNQFIDEHGCFGDEYRSF